MSTIIGDIWNFHLAITGIAVSMFTLFFSSYISKAEEKNVLLKIKDGSIDIQNRMISINNELEIIKTIEKRIVKVIGGSAILFLFSSISKYIDCCNNYLIWSNLIMTIILCFYILSCTRCVYKYFNNRVI